MPSGPSPDCPIIVGGCNRSGTTLVRRLLDKHSRIHCGPEVKFFADLFGTLPDPNRMFSFFDSAQALAGPDELLAIMGPGFVTLHERAARAAGKARWADKVPENVLFCAHWQRLLGDDWKLVQVVRNPLDTVASLSESPFGDIPKETEAQIDHYRAYMVAPMRFASAHPERHHMVVYEQLVAAPEQVLAELMDFLGESSEPGQLVLEPDPLELALEDWKYRFTNGVHRQSVNRWRDVLVPGQAQLIWDRTFDLWEMIDPDGRWMATP